ncbi:MAG: hypothetical protein JNM85_05585 [Chthonomonas sp.]|nr:hypothetical protein [Chthonomonas sp.]
MNRTVTNQPDLHPDVLAVFESIAEEWGEKYFSEFLLPSLQTQGRAASAKLEDVVVALQSPFRCLHAFFGHYAFARRGRDRDDLSQLACLALRRLAAEDTFTEFLEQSDGDALWDQFCQVCTERNHKISEQLNRGVIAGMLELSQEIYRLDGIGSIAGWAIKGIEKTRRVEPQFMRIVDIRGVGPKTTATFLRDLIAMFEVEDSLENVDRLYVQPIDRWTRMFAYALIDEFEDREAADWVVAGKLSKYCRWANVSGLRFNMGATLFGTKQVRDPQRFHSCLERLITN